MFKSQCYAHIDCKRCKILEICSDMITQQHSTYIVPSSRIYSAIRIRGPATCPMLTKAFTIAPQRTTEPPLPPSCSRLHITQTKNSTPSMIVS